MDLPLPTPDLADDEDLDPQLDDLDEDDAHDDDNYPHDNALADLGVDPIEEVFVQGLGTRELLHRVKCALARMVASLEWTRLHSGFSASKKLEVSRALGRRQRALMTLCTIALAEEREAAEPDPPSELVERVLGMLQDEVLKVLHEVATPEQESAFRNRLEKIAG
jgi:hypothetical protein